MISTIITRVMELAPCAVLDIGPGHGKYGLLMREYLGRDATLIAVEPWPQALLCADVYDDVIVNSFPSRVWVPPTGYDLVLLIDVLEHYEWVDGLQALDAALQLAPVLLSTPHRPCIQGSVGGNVFEAHCSAWTLEMLQMLASVHVELVAEHSEQLICLLTPVSVREAA